MEENLEAVGSVLGNLKSMAVDMGTEIDKQNKHIDSITAKVSPPHAGILTSASFHLHRAAFQRRRSS